MVSAIMALSMSTADFFEELPEVIHTDGDIDRQIGSRADFDLNVHVFPFLWNIFLQVLFPAVNP